MQIIGESNVTTTAPFVNNMENRMLKHVTYENRIAKTCDLFIEHLRKQHAKHVTYL